MYYFAYGSNMNPNRMAARGVSYYSLAPGLLKEYSINFNKKSSGLTGEGYANISKTKYGLVEGILYKIRKGDIYKLDYFERYPAEYSRITLEIELSKIQKVKAFVYIAQPGKIYEGLRPSRIYLNHLLAAKRFLTLQYYEYLYQVETID